jgi:hypothetical protein
MDTSARKSRSAWGPVAATLLLMASTVTACSSSSSAGGCVPGASVACIGTGGCSGSQVCSADGETYGACACGSADGGADRDASSKKDSGARDAGRDAHDATVVPPDALTIDANRPDGSGSADGSSDVSDDGAGPLDGMTSPDVHATDATHLDATAVDGGPQDAGAPTFDAASTVTCSYSTTFICTPSANCFAPPPVNTVEANVPVYVVTGCFGMTTAPITPSNFSIVVDAPQVFDQWTDESDMFCLGTDSAYPGEYVSIPFELIQSGTWSAFMSLNGTAATVSVSGTQELPVPGCGTPMGIQKCLSASISCSGSATALLSSCDMNNGGCDVNATCTWTGETTNSCACNTGYTGNGKTCTPVPNPCLVANGGCDVHALCADQNGVAMCSCNAGYSGNGIECIPNP